MSSARWKIKEKAAITMTFAMSKKAIQRLRCCNNKRKREQFLCVLFSKEGKLGYQVIGRGEWRRRCENANTTTFIIRIHTCICFELIKIGSILDTERSWIETNWKIPCYCMLLSCLWHWSIRQVKINRNLFRKVDSGSIFGGDQKSVIFCLVFQHFLLNQINVHLLSE